MRPPQAGTTVPVPGRCSDLVVGPPHTADGHLWVAHNNDLGEASEADILAVEWRVPGEPVVFSLGIGPWISVGWNSAGLSLTGNELSPNDERVGVPRLLMVRQQLTAGTIDEAIAMALRPIGPAATTPSSPIATVGPSTWRGARPTPSSARSSPAGRSLTRTTTSRRRCCGSRATRPTRCAPGPPIPGPAPSSRRRSGPRRGR